mmetsp:Transcript_76104/g.204221  ORF Transcript_76104/g.204221 Transcript_76104/m.204221 type:complete len:209 (+) Transcript_76104:438-1064(+)
MPSCGDSLTSSESIFTTSVNMTTSSSAQPCLDLATSCFMAVRKPCPLLKPGSQYDLGRPCLSQRSNCSWRLSRIWNQMPTVGENQAPLSHMAGTLALNMASSALARSSDMTMVPAMAICRFLSVDRTTEMDFCSTSISWRKAMMMGLVAPIFCSAACCSSLLKSAGTLLSRSTHISVTMSSRDLPPPPPPRGCVSRMVSKRSVACCRR